MRSVFTILLLFYYVSTVCASYEREVYMCLVCKNVVNEITNKIATEDPRRKIEVGGYRLDINKDEVNRPYVRSQVHLTEIFESVCKEMDNYARGRYKDTGEPTILKFIGENGYLNPKTSEIDFVTDSDLNRSLEYYCQQIIEENEDELVQLLSTESKETAKKICDKKYCKERVVSHSYRDIDSRSEL